MVKIRLARQGSGHNIFYRIVAINKQSKRNGQAIDIIGYWQPSKNVKQIDTKKIANWVAKGAIVSQTVAKLIEK